MPHTNDSDLLFDWLTPLICKHKCKVHTFKSRISSARDAKQLMFWLWQIIFDDKTNSVKNPFLTLKKKLSDMCSNQWTFDYLFGYRTRKIIKMWCFSYFPVCNVSTQWINCYVVLTRFTTAHNILWCCWLCLQQPNHTRIERENVPVNVQTCYARNTNSTYTVYL